MVPNLLAWRKLVLHWADRYPSQGQRTAVLSTGLLRYPGGLVAKRVLFTPSATRRSHIHLDWQKGFIKREHSDGPWLTWSICSRVCSIVREIIGKSTSVSFRLFTGTTFIVPICHRRSSASSGAMSSIRGYCADRCFWIRIVEWSISRNAPWQTWDWCGIGELFLFLLGKSRGS